MTNVVFLSCPSLTMYVVYCIMHVVKIFSQIDTDMKENKKKQQSHYQVLHFSGPPPSVTMVCVEPVPLQQTISVSQSPLQDLFGEGILWAVPKNRRSREKRLTRKFGSETGHKKMLPVLKLLTCNNCGHVHEPGRLCRKFTHLIFRI